MKLQFDIPDEVSMGFEMDQLTLIILEPSLLRSATSIKKVEKTKISRLVPR
jgi:hypothetical protein